MKTINLVLIIITIFALTISVAFSNANMDLDLHVYGTVFDDQQNRVSNAKISISTPQNCELVDGNNVAYSNNNGDYNIYAYYICDVFPETFTINAIKDNAYNTQNFVISESGSYNVNVIFHLDLHPPTISFTPNFHDWTNQNVAVTISANDYSTVKEIYYKIISSSSSCPSTGYSSASGSSKTVTISNNGQWKVCAYAVDQYNNAGSPISSDVYKVDKVLPVTTIAPNKKSWTNSAISVKISGSDSDSGIKNIYYKVIDNSASCPAIGSSSYQSTTSSSKTVTISDNGQWKVCAYAKDVAGNIGSIKASGTYQYDNQVPTISITSPNNNVHINSHSVTVTWSGSDSLSGIAYYEYKLDNGNWVSTSSTSHTFDLNDGSHTVYVKAVDKAGNSNTDDVHFTVDTTAPTITFDPDSYGGWTNTPYNVIINASDSGSGVKALYYNISEYGKDCPAVGSSSYKSTTSSSKTITISNSGKWEICAYAVDTLGNTPHTATKSGIYKFDNQPPTVSITNPNENDYLNSSSITVTWSGYDALSGILFYRYKLDNGNWHGTFSTSHTFDLNDGPHTVYVEAIDNAENSNTTSVHFTVDTIAPSIGFHPNSHDWTNQSINVEVSANDVNPIEKLYYDVVDHNINCPAVGSSSYQSTTSSSKTVTISDNGQWKVCAYAKDMAGNVQSPIASGTYKVDKIPPMINIVSPVSGDHINSSSVTVTWFGDDSISEIVYYEYKLDNGNWVSTSSTSHTFDLNDGSHTVYVKAVDKAGNSNTDDVHFTVDTTAPTITFDPDGSNWVQNLLVTIEFSDSSGIMDNEYKVINASESCGTDLSTYQEYNAQVNLNQNGQWKVCAYAKDMAGNSKFAESNIYKIDNEKPYIGIAGTNLPYYNGIYYSKAGLKVKTFAKVSDKFSGINKCYYTTKYGQIEGNYNGTHCIYTYIEPSNSGGVTFWFKALDNAGNSNNGGSATIKVDNQNPSISISTKKYWNTLPIEINWQMSDNVLVTKYDITVDSTTHSYNYNQQSGSGVYDINLVSNGNHYVKFKIYDIVNNTNEDSLNFCFDNQIPNLDLENPIISGTTVTFKWDTNDNGCSGINHSELYLDNNLIYSGTDTSYTKDVTSGDHNWKVIVYDNAGNSIEKDSSIHVDNTAPKIYLISPVEGYLNSNSITLKFKATDDLSNELNCRAVVNNTEIWKGTIQNDTEKDIQISENDGHYNWNISCVDDAGNEGNSNSWFVVDTQAPQTTINAVNNDGTPYNWGWTNQNVNVTFSVSDANPNVTYYKIDNGDWKVYNGMFSISTNGNYSIEYYSIDMAGNKENVKENYIAIDKEIPSVNIISPINNSFTNDPNILINWTGNDNVQIVDYKLDIDGNVIDVGTDTNYQTTLSEGIHNAIVTAIDEAGNQNTSKVTFTIDLTPPLVDITSPDNNSIHSGNSLPIYWNSNDNYGIDHFDVYLNGNLLGSTNSNSYELDNLNDGKYVAKVVAFDKAGNTNESEITFYIDNTPPKIEFISPIDWTNENPTIVFNVEDVEPTIRCIVDMDGNQIYNQTSSPGKIEIPLTNVFGGNHNLNITCSDLFYKSDITQTIKVDNDTPTLSIVSPSNGARIPIGSFVVTVKANDNYSGIKYIKVIFGNKEYNAIFDGKEWKITLNPTTTGTKSIVVKTSDKVGHQTSKGVDVTLYTPSTGSGGFAGGGTGCTVVGYSCNANSDCCTGYCNAGICANYPKDVNLSVKITPTSWEMYDNETAKFTILIENNGKDLAKGVTLSLSGVNGTLSESTFDLGGKNSKIVYLNVKEGIGDYVGKVSAKWGNISDTASFSLKVLDHNIPMESKLASSICSNASAHIVNLASSGMNVSELYKEYNKAINEMKKGNYSGAKTICQNIINTKSQPKTTPTKITPFFIRVGNGIKDNWAYVGIATGLIAGIAIWVKREAIARWYQLRKFH